MHCALERFACLCLSMKCHPELFLEPCNGFHELALSISKRKYFFYSKTSGKVPKCHRILEHDSDRSISFVRV